MEKEPVRELHELECWELLEDHEFGRLAYHQLDEVHIVPVNYRLHDRQLLFSTGEGSKLLGVVMNDDVAFEIDGVDGATAWSVVARGRARVLDEHEAHVADAVGLRSWVDTPKYNVVAVDLHSVTGRGFELDRPWLTITGARD